jgi:hypothetical protein
MLAVVLCVLGVALLPLALAEPQVGQLIRDPANPRWLTRKGSEGSPVALVGPGDPEGFLYLGRVASSVERER